jgi:hypothetical protein
VAVPCWLGLHKSLLLLLLLLLLLPWRALCSSCVLSPVRQQLRWRPGCLEWVLAALTAALLTALTAALDGHWLPCHVVHRAPLLARWRCRVPAWGLRDAHCIMQMSST